MTAWIDWQSDYVNPDNIWNHKILERFCLKAFFKSLMTPSGGNININIWDCFENDFKKNDDIGIFSGAHMICTWKRMRTVVQVQMQDGLN